MLTKVLHFLNQETYFPFFNISLKQPFLQGFISTKNVKCQPTVKIKIKCDFSPQLTGLECKALVRFGGRKADLKWTLALCSELNNLFSSLNLVSVSIELLYLLAKNYDSIVEAKVSSYLKHSFVKLYIKIGCILNSFHIFYVL